MREILFRGAVKGEKRACKDCEHGTNYCYSLTDVPYATMCKLGKQGCAKWVEGHFVQYKDKPMITFILDDYGEGYVVTHVDIVPETAGQYTGVKDKNGVKIFEGDIVKINNKHIDYVAFETGCFLMKKQLFNYEFTYQDPESMEVIGNIYDNPELLETE